MTLTYSHLDMVIHSLTIDLSLCHGQLPLIVGICKPTFWLYLDLFKEDGVLLLNDIPFTNREILFTTSSDDPIILNQGIDKKNSPIFVGSRLLVLFS